MNLSARSYLIALVIAVVGVVGQWTGGPLELAWRLPAAVWVALLWWEWRQTRRSKVELTRGAPTRVALGKPFSGALRATNRGRAPVQLELQQTYPTGVDGAPASQRISVAARASLDVPFTATPVELGRQPWPAIYSRELGALGLAWWKRVLPTEGELEVEPERLDRRPAEAGETRAGRKTAPRPGAGQEFLGLRDYRPGDPLRLIDWKATARRRAPVVRQFSEEQHMELLLLIDLGRTSRLQAGALSRLHHYVNIAARLAELAAAAGDRVGLLAFAERVEHVVPPGRDAGTLLRLRHTLGKLQAHRGEPNVISAALEARAVLRQRGLVILLTDVDEQTAAEQLLQAVRLLAPKHLPLIATVVDEEVEALAHAPAEHWLDPYRNYAAQETLHARARTLEHLRRLGAEVVSARPGRLDAAVMGHYAGLRARRRV